MKNTQQHDLLDPVYGNYGVARPHRSIERITSSISDKKNGRICVGTSVGGNYVLFRVHDTGELDRDFGTNDGLTEGKFNPPLSSYGSKVHLLEDGKILMVGTHNGLQPALARFSSNGILDTSFGNDGHIVIERPSVLQPSSAKRASSEFHAALDAQSAPGMQALVTNGKIYLTFKFGNTDSVIMRFNADGALDTDFNGTGFKNLTPPWGSDTYATAILLDGDFILLGGSVMADELDKACLIRLHGNGEYDSTFGNKGFAFAELTSHAGFLSIAKLSSNTIVCAGGEVPRKGVIAAFDNQGQPMADFTTTSLNTSGYWKTVAIHNDQAIIAVGNTSVGEADLLVGRFLANGQPDSGFYGNGWLSFSPGKSMNIVSSSEVQSDGRTLVTGEDYEYGKDKQGGTRKGFLLRCLTAP